MGLHLCYELRLAPEVSATHVAELVSQLRTRALELPFQAVSPVVRLTEELLVRLPRLHGLSFTRLEDVAHATGVFTREELYAHSVGVKTYSRSAKDVYHSISVPSDVSTVGYGFGIAVGDGSEPASLGVVQVAPAGCDPSSWGWHCCCKTQYASVHGDENLLHCHQSLIAALEAARSLGFDVTVRDETGYWDSRDPQQLLRAVADMNRIVARIAGHFTDAVRSAGSDSRIVQGEIFNHPDFERLEMPESATGNDPDERAR
jgi:hypothetical protein